MNYNTLYSKLQRWAQDSGTDFQTAIPDMIYDAELMISKDIGFDQMRVYSTLALVNGTHLYNKPAGCVAIRHIWYVDATGATNFLEFRRREMIQDYWPNTTVTTATPTFWTNYDSGAGPNLSTPILQIWVAGTPNASFTGVIENEQRIVGLSSTQPDTWISDNQEDLLFAACILKGAKFDKNPGDETRWQNDYTKFLVTTQAELDRIRSDATSITRAV